MDKLLPAIKARILELKEDWRNEPNPNNNHIASMIIGEIDGLKWVWEWVTGDEFEDSNFDKEIDEI